MIDPNWDEQRSDIVQTIQFDDREKLLNTVKEYKWVLQ